jgi:hypothetical protein
VFVALFVLAAGIFAVASAQKSADAAHEKKSSSNGEAKPRNPLYERFYALAKLYEKDQAFPPGQKRFLSRAMAHELHDLCLHLRLPKAALAVQLDKPLPK